MTLQRANWLAQQMRKWGFRAKVLKSAVREGYVVFAYHPDVAWREGYAYSYEDAVRL